MSNLQQALADIHTIRRRVAETTEFRGYGPFTLGATAVVALLAGLAQAHWLPDPTAHPRQYVSLWLGTATLCAALIGAEMVARANRLHSGLANEMIRLAVAQFLPAGVSGALVPMLLLRSGGAVLWTLPGLWQIIFSLGVFASCRSLPRPMLLVGTWFLLSGLFCLALGDARALAPAAMAGTFAAGMGLVAAVHAVFAKERGSDEPKQA